MKARVTSAIEFCGLLSLVVGVSMFSVGLAFIVGGLALIAIGILQ